MGEEEGRENEATGMLLGEEEAAGPGVGVAAAPPDFALSISDSIAFIPDFAFSWFALRKLAPQLEGAGAAHVVGSGEVEVGIADGAG
mmetsp:Transcript_5736/g.7754  ORF Transcript_5736/g.7754 Transcript_5736/m.7754 type:complete len:87 (-) Transcript_5736:16-276(-)